MLDLLGRHRSIIPAIAAWGVAAVQWLGHASLEVTAIYANALGAEQRAIAPHVVNAKFRVRNQEPGGGAVELKTRPPSGNTCHTPPPTGYTHMVGSLRS